jgi:hypothetical protein
MNISIAISSVGNVAGIAEIRNAYRLLIGRQKEKNLLGRTRCR